jgi:hypothetical protein
MFSPCLFKNAAQLSRLEQIRDYRIGKQTTPADAQPGTQTR